jgi:hypothetical protein
MAARSIAIHFLGADIVEHLPGELQVGVEK